MSQLTTEYIDAHKVELHNYESFGRSLIEQILNASQDKLESLGGASDAVEIDAKIKVEPFKPEGCTKVTINVGFVKITKHI